MAPALVRATASAMSAATFRPGWVFFIVVSWLLAGLVARVERVLFVLEIDVLPRDDRVGHVGPDLEWITLGDDEIRLFADGDAAEPIADAKDVGGVLRQRLDRIVVRQAPCHGLRRVIGQQTRVVSVAGGEG